MPFSAVAIAHQFAQRIPAGASVHASILNSLRVLNFFPIKAGVDFNCNVGGFGIDGAVSTLVGQSVTNRNRLFFAQFGDLAFFYDMNILGNRHLGKNLRILLVNNNIGAEFRINPWLEKDLGKDGIEPFIAARGHNGHARDWATSCGFTYMTASTPEEFLQQIDEFCHPDIDHFDRPVIFEVFTKSDDETVAIQAMRRKDCPANLGSGRCSTTARLLSCFILNKQKRREFRRKHSK